MTQHLLVGEDPDTRDLGEIRHWIRVYTQAWKTQSERMTASGKSTTDAVFINRK